MRHRRAGFRQSAKSGCLCTLALSRDARPHHPRVDRALAQQLLRRRLTRLDQHPGQRLFGSSTWARSLGQGMQDVDRPAHIQSLPEPAGARRPRVDVKTDRVVTRAERRDGITGHGSRRRHLGQRAAIRPPKLERPVGPA